jgi:hypothetical protein
MFPAKEALAVAVVVLCLVGVVIGSTLATLAVV